jgi:hypothetical protein
VVQVCSCHRRHQRRRCCRRRHRRRCCCLPDHRCSCHRRRQRAAPARESGPGLRPGRPGPTPRAAPTPPLQPPDGVRGGVQTGGGPPSRIRVPPRPGRVPPASTRPRPRAPSPPPALRAPGPAASPPHTLRARPGRARPASPRCAPPASPRSRSRAAPRPPPPALRAPTRPARPGPASPARPAGPHAPRHPRMSQPGLRVSEPGPSRAGFESRLQSATHTGDLMCKPRHSFGLAGRRVLRSQASSPNTRAEPSLRRRRHRPLLHPNHRVAGFTGWPASPGGRLRRRPAREPRV